MRLEEFWEMITLRCVGVTCSNLIDEEKAPAPANLKTQVQNNEPGAPGTFHDV